MNEALQVIGDICVGTKASNRESLLRYESMAKKMPQVDIPVTHRIHGGMYAREITIPKDTILTGHIYKFDHFDVMISGDITVSTDTGETKRFTGYNCFKGMAGKKRAGVAHEDTTWITFHPVTGKDGDEIQKRITAETFEELKFFNESVNNADYELLVSQSNMTQHQITEQVTNGSDQIKMPMGYENIYTAKSFIHGEGLYSHTKINANSVICPSRIQGNRTPAGRYTNHAVQPNAYMTTENNDIMLVSNRDIEANEEITINYRDTLTMRFSKGDLCQE